MPAANEPLIAVDHRSSSAASASSTLDKPPGMAETIDWVSALSALGAAELVRDDVVRTLERDRQDRPTTATRSPPRSTSLGYAGSARP